MAIVVFVTTSYPRYPGDPAGHFVATEAEHRARSGDAVIVLAPGANDARTAGTHEPSFPNAPQVRWLPGGDAFGWPGVLERLRERPSLAVDVTTFMASACHAIRALKPDRVIAHWMIPSAWPIAAFGTGALEIVLHGADVRLVEKLPRALRVALIRSLLARGAHFRFVSRDLRERLVAATVGAAADLDAHSSVAPCALDVERAPSRAEARAHLRIDEAERLAVIVGRLVRSKRPDVALRMAVASGAARITVVGDGPALPELRHANPTVNFVGRRARHETLTWIVAADLLVSASREEGAPTVVREARALGTPVLAVPSGDLREWAALDPGITLIDD